MAAFSRLRPNWWLWLLTLFMFSLFIKLGFWQLQRAEQKKNLQQQFDLRLHSPPVSLQQLPKKGDWHFYPVTLRGFYDNAHSIFLDNKIQNHQVGYEVVTPFINDEQSSVVLVNRGWIPQGQNRQTLPNLPPVVGQQQLSGWIYIPNGKPFTLGQATDAQHNWPLRMEAMELPILEKALNKPLFPFIVLLSPQSAHGFVRNWQPTNMSAAKHIGYAVQWFTFALVLIIIFIALNLRRARFRS